MEYGWVGMTEKVAEQTLAKDGQKPSVYMLRAMPLEWSIGTEHARDKKAMVKIIADPKGHIMGIHFVAPNAGEIMQGLGVAFRKGLTMDDIEESVAIHPTTAEMAVKIDSKRHMKNSTETQKAQKEFEQKSELPKAATPSKAPEPKQAAPLKMPAAAKPAMGFGFQQAGPEMCIKPPTESAPFA